MEPHVAGFKVNTPDHLETSLVEHLDKNARALTVLQIEPHDLIHANERPLPPLLPSSHLPPQRSFRQGG